MNLSPMNFILLPLTLLLIVIVIRSIVPVITTRLSGLMTWKRSFILAGIYLGVLILLVPMLFMLPDEGYIKLIDNKDQASVQSQIIIGNFHDHILTEESLDKQQGLYKISSHIFKVDTNKLSFLYNEQNITGDYRILVERKDVDDGVIGVSTYATTQLVGGIDFTKLVSPPTISFQEGTLSIMAASHQTFDFKQLKNDFTLDQFKLQNYGNFIGMSASFGPHIIYIRVPKDLELDKGKYSDQIQVLSSR